MPLSRLTRREVLGAGAGCRDQTDPKENVNLAVLPERAGQVRQFAEMLRAGWRAAAPR